MFGNKAVNAIVLAGAALVALVFVKLMYDMSANMARMTDHVGAMSRDVAAMKLSMDTMSNNMAQMRESMQRMGGAVEQGGKVFQQWDPTKMLRQ